MLSRLKQNPTVRKLAHAIGLLKVEAADPDHYHGEVARDYLNKRLQQESWHREQEVVGELLGKLPEGLGVLDVPVGTGRFVEMCMARRMSVTGVDISQDMLDMARQTLGNELYGSCRMIKGSADALPFDAAAFELVICFRFFGLIPMALSERVMRELRRVCGRWMIIRVPVRKDSAPPLPPAIGNEPVGGRLYERELLDEFRREGLLVRERRSVEERSDVSYLVYLLELEHLKA